MGTVKYAKLLMAFSILVSVLFLSVANPQASKTTGPSLVRVPYKSPAQIADMVERGIEIIHLSPKGHIDVVADAKQLDYLFSLQVPVSVIETPRMALAAPALDANLGDYHTYAEMVTALQNMETNYPALASLGSIGTSIEGRTLYLLKISDNVTVDEDEPEVLYIGCHHARELMSVDIPLRFAQYLLDNYGSLPEVTALVDSREIFFVPMLNPDGHYYVQLNHDGPSYNWWRKNRRDNGDGSYGVDLNRNYSYAWGYDDIGSSPIPSDWTYRGTAPFSEPETQALRDFANSRNFIIWLSYHSYGELLLYPWGYYAGYTADHELFYALGDTLTSSNGYYDGNTAMGAIYPTNGDSDDWGYGDTTEKDAVFAFTPELNSYEEGGFSPPDTLIMPTFNKVLPMNMLALDLAGTPERVLPPTVPAMYPVEDPYHPIYTLSWSGNVPGDPNPVSTYELVEYKNLSTIAQDAAESMSPLWDFDGFTLGGRSYEGSSSYYSNTGNNLANSLEMATFYHVSEETDTFSFQAWYDIESDYDYAYCEVSTDEGLIWTPIEGNITTTYNPYGSNLGHGITGASGGWVQAHFPLGDYMGQDIGLRLRYVTDAYVYEEGFYCDLLGPVTTYEQLTNLGNSFTDSSHTVIPSETGNFAYRVRAIDADGHRSRWSNTASIQIDDVTNVPPDPAPLSSRLGANYPNPFNPVTRIPYWVGPQGATGNARVTLRIYSVSGALITTLVDRSHEQGRYSATWRGTDDSGRLTASGVYFARLTVGSNEVFTRKLVLLK
jgi:hypothetical protein